MKNFHFIFAGLISLISFGCSKTRQYRIEGSLGALNPPATVYLLEIKEQAYVVRDSAILENGRFTFKGNVDTVTEVILALNNEGSGYQSASERTVLYLEPGNIIVEDSTGGLREAVVRGAPNNDAKIRFYEEVTAPLREMEVELTKKQQEAAPEMLNNDTLRADLAAAEDRYMKYALKLTGDFIYANPDVYISLQQLAGMIGLERTDRVEILYNKLSDDLKRRQFGRDLASIIGRIKLLEVGAEMPDFTLPDASGNLVSSADFRGQYLLIDLWAAWCAPCRAENPNLVAAYLEYKDRNFSILGVSLDDSKEQWLAAIEKDGLTWTQVSDLKLWNSAAVTHFAITSIPMNFLVDPSGKIIARNLHGQALRNKLEELLDSGNSHKVDI